MKMKHGFVSNSSTTSFCIYGASFENEEITKFLEKNGVEHPDDDHVGELEELDKFKEAFLEVHCGPDSDYGDYGIYLGRSFDSIKDDETGKEFKESIEKNLSEFFGRKVKCSCIKEAWRDG